MDRNVGIALPQRRTRRAMVAEATADAEKISITEEGSRSILLFPCPPCLPWIISAVP